jgi:hypothetical protein
MFETMSSSFLHHLNWRQGFPSSHVCATRLSYTTRIHFSTEARTRLTEILVDWGPALGRTEVCACSTEQQRHHRTRLSLTQHFVTATPHELSQNKRHRYKTCACSATPKWSRFIRRRMSSATDECATVQVPAINNGTQRA